MSKKIESIFSEISGVYDLANHAYSLGVDILWRKRAASEALLSKKNYKILDVGTGTGDLAIEVAWQTKKAGKLVDITGIDMNSRMLNRAREKVASNGFTNVALMKGNALSMPFGDGSFDVVTSAFALRNFDSVEEFSKELKRVMKTNGKFVLIDMAKPDDALQRMLFRFYFGVIMHMIAYRINRKAYTWLYSSIMAFDKKKLMKIIKDEGFRNVRIKNLESGVCFMVTGNK